MIVSWHYDVFLSIPSYKTVRELNFVQPQEKIALAFHCGNVTRQFRRVQAVTREMEPQGNGVNKATVAFTWEHQRAIDCIVFLCCQMEF